SRPLRDRESTRGTPIRRAKAILKLRKYRWNNFGHAFQQPASPENLEDQLQRELDLAHVRGQRRDLAGNPLRRSNES
ncbi:MAG: hypothetical protein ABSG13_26920, partial [Bryobacteraceae bacterium]